MTLCVAEEHSTNMEWNSARMLGYMMPPRVPDEEAEDDEDEDSAPHRAAIPKYSFLIQSECGAETDVPVPHRASVPSARPPRSTDSGPSDCICRA
jgi:hypothetical protein